MDVVDSILDLSQKHGKYAPGAYTFVFEVLDCVGKETGGGKHLTGKQLALAAFVFSLDRYGKLASLVWQQMGMQSSEDLGQVVFHLVEEKLIGKQEQDEVGDFDGIFTIKDFDDVKMSLTGERGRWLEIVEKGKGFNIKYVPPEKLGLGEG